MEIMETHKIVFTSKSENIVYVERLIDKVCEELKVSEDHYGNILVALTEAVNNAIQHGNKSNPSKEINVIFETKNDLITFKVRDEGDGFDYNNIPDPTEPENIEKPHGRGIFLMKNLADKVDFYENGRVVELHFKICNN